MDPQPAGTFRFNEHVQVSMLTRATTPSWVLTVTGIWSGDPRFLGVGRKEKESLLSSNLLVAWCLARTGAGERAPFSSLWSHGAPGGWGRNLSRRRALQPTPSRQGPKRRPVVACWPTIRDLRGFRAGESEMKPRSCILRRVGTKR
jgi:hypothetical protein